MLKQGDTLLTVDEMTLADMPPEARSLWLLNQAR